MGDVHNRTRYLAGCRCDECKAAQSKYRKERRQKENAEKAAPRVMVSVPDLPTSPASESFSVLDAVNEELSNLSTTAERPGLAAAARAMAMVLDSPAALPQHPSAAGKLAELLETLGKNGRQRKGKLAAVREMTAGA